MKTTLSVIITAILLLIVLTIISSCKKEDPDVEPTYCWDCYSYVTTIDTLHNYSFQDHFETDTICDKTEDYIDVFTDEVIYKDTFTLSPGINYVCFRVYVTHCVKIKK